MIRHRLLVNILGMLVRRLSIVALHGLGGAMIALAGVIVARIAHGLQETAARLVFLQHLPSLLQKALGVSWDLR